MPRWTRLEPFSLSLALSITLGAMAPVLGGCGGHCSGIVPCVIIQIQISPANPSVAVGSTQQFKVSGDYLDGFVADVSSNVTWSSSDTTIATISPGGLATALKAGSATITATSQGTQRLTDSTTLTVTAPPPTLASIALTPANPSVTAGNTAQFKATGTFSDGSTVDINLLGHLELLRCDPGDYQRLGAGHGGRHRKAPSHRHVRLHFCFHNSDCCDQRD